MYIINSKIQNIYTNNAYQLRNSEILLDSVVTIEF